jgi:hypothetical protein
MVSPQVGDKLDMHRGTPNIPVDLTYSARLRDVITAMYAGGPDAQEIHDQAVERLKRDPEEMMVAVIAAYGRCPASDYPLRQALVHAATVMGHPAALPFLISVALSDIPAETSPDTHSFSTVAEETILRMAAVDGIVNHATLRNRHAIDALMRCVESPSFSIRRAAVLGLMASPGARRLRPRIQALIPRDQHFIFDLKKISVRDATQVQDPRRHLVEDYEEFGERKPEISRSPGADSTKPETK